MCKIHEGLHLWMEDRHPKTSMSTNCLQMHYFPALPPDKYLHVPLTQPWVGPAQFIKYIIHCISFIHFNSLNLANTLIK